MLDIPVPFPRVFDLPKQHTMVKPGDLCSNLLHKLLIRICLSKRPHILEVSLGNLFHLRGSVLNLAMDGESEPLSMLAACYDILIAAWEQAILIHEQVGN